MESLSERLRVPNIEHSIGVPDWSDSGSIRDFLAGDPTVVAADDTCAVGFRLAPDGGGAACFVHVGDGDEYPSWMPSGIQNARVQAEKSGAIRFDAWVPGWNVGLISQFEDLDFHHDGLLRDVVFAWNSWWNVHILAYPVRHSNAQEGAS